jgi:hypothetical protein
LHLTLQIHFTNDAEQNPDRRNSRDKEGQNNANDRLSFRLNRRISEQSLRKTQGRSRQN